MESLMDGVNSKTSFTCLNQRVFFKTAKSGIIALL